MQSGSIYHFEGDAWATDNASSAPGKSTFFSISNIRSRGSANSFLVWGKMVVSIADIQSPAR
jgi:hypothetical protein